MQLSVIIPTNNITSQTVSTVKSLMFDDLLFEILIIIDMVNTIDVYFYNELKKIKNVKLIQSNDKPGIANTLNVGMVASTATTIMRIDDGDINLRSDLAEEFDLLQSYDLVCGAMSIKRMTKTAVVKPKIIYRDQYLSPFSIIPHPTWVFNKQSAKILYDDQDVRCEDFGFLFRNKMKIISTNKVVTDYDIHNKLSYGNELLSAYKKYQIGMQKPINCKRSLEFLAYLIIRIIRLTFTRKKVIRHVKT